MGGRKAITTHKRKIGKTGNVDSPSYFITLPIEVVRALSWREGQTVQIKKSRGKVVIETGQESENELNRH